MLLQCSYVKCIGIFRPIGIHVPSTDNPDSFGRPVTRCVYRTRGRDSYFYTTQSLTTDLDPVRGLCLVMRGNPEDLDSKIFEGIVTPVVSQPMLSTVRTFIR